VTEEFFIGFSKEFFWLPGALNYEFLTKLRFAPIFCRIRTGVSRALNYGVLLHVVIMAQTWKAREYQDMVWGVGLLLNK